jgi:hypothetical protein
VDEEGYIIFTEDHLDSAMWTNKVNVYVDEEGYIYLLRRPYSP